VIPGVVLLVLVIGACGSASNRATATSPVTVSDGATRPTNESSCGVGGNPAIQRLLASRHIEVTVDRQSLDIRTIGFQVCAAAQRDLMAAQMPAAARDSLRASAQAECQPLATTNMQPATTFQTATTTPLTTARIPPTTSKSTPAPSSGTTLAMQRTSTPPAMGSIPPTTWVSQPVQVATASTTEIESGIAQAILDDVLYRDAVARGKALTIEQAQAAAKQYNMTGDPQTIARSLTVSRMLQELVGSTKCEAEGARIHDYLIGALSAHHVKVRGDTGWTTSNYIDGIANTAAAQSSSPGV
jgi:hypothetical protein